MKVEVTRRNFARAVALGVAAAPLLPAAQAQQATPPPGRGRGAFAPHPPRNMKIGHTGITWPRSEGGPADQAIKDLGSLGYWGFETFGETLDAYEAQGGIAKVLDANNLPLISGYCTIDYVDPAKRKEGVEKMAAWGRIIRKIEKSAEAEAPLRRAIAIDAHNSDPAIDADRESLALALEAQEKRGEAFEYFRQAAEGSNARVAARSYAKLAGIDREHAEDYYRNAVASEEKASGTESPPLAVLLQEYALELRARNRDAEAEPILRRALSIQRSAAKADPQVTVGVLNTLGNLLEGRQKLDEAEKLERVALTISEEMFGPESVQMAMTCTNLADVLWNKKKLQEAGLLYRRAIAIDASLYGPDRPETAADLANLGMLMKDAGQATAGAALLRQALAIYEKTLGPVSDQAQFVRQRLNGSGR